MNVMPAWAFETRNLVTNNLLWLWNVCKYNVNTPSHTMGEPTLYRNSPLQILQRAILHMHICSCHLVAPYSDPVDPTLWEC